MSNFRQIKPYPITGITPAPDITGKPKFEWVDPKELFVEEKYQRNIGDKSVKLIRHIVQNWEWNRMKTPICARDEKGKLFVVDGQHTAIAAASHPDINKIPVMVTQMDTMEERASAFIGHNRDRVAMTPMQIYHASVVAGDEVATAMNEACKKAGVTIRKSPPPNGIYKEGETVAVKAIESVVTKKGHAGGSRVLKVLVDAGRTPIIASEIKAVAALLFDADWKDKFNEFDLATIIRSRTPEAWAAMAETQVRKGMPMSLWKAIAITWFKSVPKKRKLAA